MSGGSGGHIYLPKSNFMSIVTSPQYQQIQHPQQELGKIVINSGGQKRNYGALGSQHSGGSKEPLKLVNVYSNV